MRRIRIDYTMTNESAVESFEAEGTIKDNVMEFTDDSERKHTLTFQDDRLHYSRGGENALLFTFEKGAEHEGTYTVDDGKIVFLIQTHELKMTERSVYLTYTLKQNHVPLTHSRLQMYYEEF